MKANKINSGIDILILLMIMGITIIDSFNGVLVMNDWLSISKPYKFLILLLMLLSLLSNGKLNKHSLVLLFSFISFFIGYSVYFLSNLDFPLFVLNFIESTKYFIWPTSFIYFRMLYLQDGISNINYYVLFAFALSYVIIVFNILLGILGFGYEFYPRYNTGTKGFFFSGNEFSLLFLILTYIMAWNMLNTSRLKFILFYLFSLFLAFKIGSKTAILGVLLLILLIGLSQSRFNFLKLSLKKAAIIFSSIVLLFISGWFFIKTNMDYINNFILKRLEGYNYELTTWFLSKRNLVATDAFELFTKSDLFYRLFGKGEESFHQSFRMVELDFVDLLMNHGYIGLALYLVFIFSIFISLYNHTRPFDKFIFYTFILVVFILANMSGHIINTGIPGYFIGMLLAMPYLTNDILSKQKAHDGS